MLDIALIREKPEWIKEQLLKRGYKADFTRLLKLDAQKRKLQKKVEDLQAERNRVSKEIARTKDSTLREQMIAAMKVIGDQIDSLKLDAYEKRIHEALASLPNIPLPEVQAGGKESNRVARTFGKKPEFNFKPKDHVELCTSLGLIDYERAARMSGSGTWVYTGMGARLEWALLNYFIDFHIANGYTFLMPPHLLNYESGYAAGQFPKFQDDVFCTSTEGGFMDDGKEQKEKGVSPKFRFILPTAETAIINMHRGEIIPPEKLPIKYFGYTPCYRKEPGSYRTSERGMIRGYQFNKVEMFIFCKSEDSPKFFDELVRNAEKLVEGLGLHYQTMALAAGDVSASMAKTYDIEVYIPSYGYKEVSSCSNAGDYQARRAGIRTRTILRECATKDGKPDIDLALGAPQDSLKNCTSTNPSRSVNAFVHTLNGSGLATSRLIPAIVEQFQTADGHVMVPPALQKYLGVKII